MDKRSFLTPSVAATGALLAGPAAPRSISHEGHIFLSLKNQMCGEGNTL